MIVEGLLAGVVFGVLTVVVIERRRRSSLHRRMLFERDGLVASAKVERICERGRGGRRREVLMRYLDRTGTARDVETVLGAAEAGAAQLRLGGTLQIRYLSGDPSDVCVVRPALLDDRPIVAYVAGSAVLAVCVSIGALLV